MATGIKLSAPYAWTLQGSQLMDEVNRVIDSLPYSSDETRKAKNSPFSVFKPTVNMLNKWRQISSFGEGIRWRAFDTTVYHYPHADLSPQYPGVNEQTEAVVVAFSGSGLTSASGRNFMQLANVMAKRGVSLVSLDYPFHRHGPRDQKYMNADTFHHTMMELVNFYKSSDLPVFLMGHSQGPLPIQELLFMEPALASAAIMFSPGGAVSRELREHYYKQDAVGAFDALLDTQTQVDDDAEAWEMAMDDQAKTKDLEAMITKIPVWIIAGDEDPWSSPNMIRALAAKYPNGTAEIVPGVGHKIFHSKLPNGKSIMSTRIVEMIEQVLGRQLPNLPKMNAPSKVLYCYKNSEMFRGWLGSVENRDIKAFVNDPKAAKDLLKQWNLWLTSAMFEIFNPEPVPSLRDLSWSTGRKLWNIRSIEQQNTEHSNRRSAFRDTWTPNHVNRALKVFGEATENRG